MRTRGLVHDERDRCANYSRIRLHDQVALFRLARATRQHMQQPRACRNHSKDLVLGQRVLWYLARQHQCQSHQILILHVHIPTVNINTFFQVLTT